MVPYPVLPPRLSSHNYYNDFDLRLSSLGPFENKPHLAVAVSGGIDSLCLALLADSWAVRRGGRVTALSVDHGLRESSREELDQVSRWLQPRGIDHHILTWKGSKPTSGLQATARNARYNLMSNWCWNANVLHLLVAHTLDDQAETFLLRLKKGSGAEGLSAMSEIREISNVRLLRPLLGVRKTDLRKILENQGQDWIEDPSNNDLAFERVRIRQNIHDGFFDAEALANLANKFGQDRIALESSVCKLLACSTRIHPAGFAFLKLKKFDKPSKEIGVRALGRIISVIGGNNYSPRIEKMDRLYNELLENFSNNLGSFSRTLGGCRVIIEEKKYNGRVLICREMRDLPKPLFAKNSNRIVWDQRFKIQFSPKIQNGTRIQALGEKGWLKISSDSPILRVSNIPNQVMPTLPALFNKDGVYFVPHLDYLRLDVPPAISSIQFYPPNSISREGFFLR